ncbi:glycoside hydrolase family 13 protein [Dacryopinax primogenitus]|uniref:Alpha-amylase n=1 Tax=Dacryopinax primogenitus (strain DJM 731) TaxID=1858805 RepID=M5FXX0_DACPD|nr:glycoside hydrolase family 13 protein [Dacryopinax primogenitus]EJU02896.1 glycoside hydrolase family 13 protein [Dacryopinax primogenitus]
MSLLLGITALLLLSPTSGLRSPILHRPRRLAKAEKSVIVQLFEWDWDSVARECGAFIGPAEGYGFVQVSPPQEHMVGPQWWTDYQPVSHNIISKRGNRAQFANMVQACRTAGVQVIADTVLNHMSAQGSGTGVGGTVYSHYSYPGIQYQDFHHCGISSELIPLVVNYDNRGEVQTCELLGLADLDTGSEYVRKLLAAYANDLASLGVTGFRLDASKHIAATDIANIVRRFVGKPYITQEVIYGYGEPIQPNEYTGNGEYYLLFRYTSALQSAFLSNGIVSLITLPLKDWVPSSSANVFVANHDTERNGNSLNYRSPSNMYWLANVFMLTWPFGTPTVLSSYDFTDHDAGAPNNGAGTCSGTGGSNGWQILTVCIRLCQHRSPVIANLLPLHNALIKPASLDHVMTGTAQQLAYGRGSTGFVAINNDDSAWSATFSTSLHDGRYCDLIAGGLSGAECAGSSYDVSRESFSATIPPRSAIALYVGSRTIPPILRRHSHAHETKNITVEFLVRALVDNPVGGSRA